MKNILFGIFILSITLSCTKENGKLSGENGKLSGENGKLSGIVTYKDSYGSSNQANVGCEIYAINEAAVKSTQYDNLTMVIGSFQINKSEYSLSIYNTIDPDRIKKLQDNFDTVSDSASKYISGFKQLPAIVRASTNGTGNYTLSLRPGKYFILFVSGSVRSNNIAEFKGNIDSEIVDIKSAGETFLDVNFEKHENIMMMLITRRQLEGC